MRPKCLVTRSAKQRQQDLKFFTGLPLRELRHRQDLVHTQQGMAYEKYIKALQSHDTSLERQSIKCKENLDAMERDLMEAIDRKAFGTGRRTP